MLQDRLQLTSILRHLILGSVPRREARIGRPAKCPPEFQREAVELVLGSGTAGT